MWGDEDCSLSHTKGSDSLDLTRHSKMFRPSCTSPSPFSLTDLDMWDTKSRFTAQTSAWCGMATVSGSGFLSKVSTSTSGSTGGLRHSDPGLRRWQSLSHLAPQGAARPSSPPRAEVRAPRGESGFRQAEVVQWLQDAHEHIDAQLDRLRARDTQLGYNRATAQLLDMKHKQLCEAMNTLEQEKEAAESPQSDRNQQRRELHDKVLRLEKDLLHMRSTLVRGSNDHPAERAPSSLSRTLPVGQGGFNRQGEQKVDTQLSELREALKEAETRARTQEEERNQALQQLQTSAETQKMLLSQVEEMNQRLSRAESNHSEVQEQLSEANNKISQACLEKAVLSTQVLKLEDNVKELKVKLTEALSDKDLLIQEKADLRQRAQVLELHLERTQGSEGREIHDADAESHSKQDQEAALMKEESEALREVNEKLTCELEMIQLKLNISQSQLQEQTAERLVSTRQIRDLEAELSQLIRQREELLSRINKGGHEMKEKCCQLRESVEVLELEKQKLQDQCLRLEAELLQSEEKLHLLQEEYRKQDAARGRNIEDLKAVASHWTEKWQKVALSLRSTQEELQELKKKSSRDGREPDSLLRVELDACKQELQLERSRRQALLRRYKDGGGEAEQTQDREAATHLSESSLSREPPSDSHSRHNKSPQVSAQSTEVQTLKEKLAESQRQLGEKEEALKSLEMLREMEKTEAQIKVSALELKLLKKASEAGGDVRGRADASVRTQLEEGRRREDRLQQEEVLPAPKLQTPNQLYPVTEEKPPAEGGKDKTFCPVNLETVQQRRMVTEQLKSLFKEREGKEEGKVHSTSAPDQTSSPQDWTPTSKAGRTPVDRWSWQQSSGLMPVFEEDEEDEEEEEEGGEPAGDQGQQMSAVSEGIRSLESKTIRLEQLIQDLQDEPPSLCPDGLFLAKLVEICSPDEDEEEGEDE